MKYLAACLAFASLVPACVTDTSDLDVESTDSELGVVLGIGTSFVQATGSNQISAYGLTATMKVRLVDIFGSPLANMPVKATIGAITYLRTTDAEGIATIKDNFVALGEPKQHTVLWSFAGSGSYRASTTSHTFTVIRSDCQVHVSSRFDPATNKQVATAYFKGRADSYWFEGMVGKRIELTNNGANLGTLTTGPRHTFGDAIHTDGHVDWSFTPTGNTGTLYASFNGDAYYAPCGDSYDYVNVKPLGAINISSQTTSATIGSTTINLTIYTRELKQGWLQPRPNTRVRVFSEQPTNGDWFDPLDHYLGEVVTDSMGIGYLSVPITNVVGKKTYIASTIRFLGHTDAPIDYFALSSEHYVTPVAKGQVRLTHAIVSSTANSYTVRWTARNAANNAPIAGLELDGPCSKMVTDANGNYSCTVDSRWDTWATVERTKAWQHVE